jgi:hypothetical protein
MLARQAVYHFEPLCQPTLCTNFAWAKILLSLPLEVVGMTGVCLHAWPYSFC